MKGNDVVRSGDYVVYSFVSIIQCQVVVPYDYLLLLPLIAGTPPQLLQQHLVYGDILACNLEFIHYQAQKQVRVR